MLLLLPRAQTRALPPHYGQSNRRHQSNGNLPKHAKSQPREIFTSTRIQAHARGSTHQDSVLESVAHSTRLQTSVSKRRAARCMMYTAFTHALVLWHAPSARRVAASHGCTVPDEHVNICTHGLQLHKRCRARLTGCAYHLARNTLRLNVCSIIARVSNAHFEHTHAHALHASIAAGTTYIYTIYRLQHTSIYIHTHACVRKLPSRRRTAAGDAWSTNTMDHMAQSSWSHVTRIFFFFFFCLSLKSK